MKIEIQNFIDKIIKSSRVTDREGLCVIQGKLAWSVSVHLNLLNDDGNVFDAFFLAAILALKNTRLPEVSLSKNSIKINTEKVKYLNVHHLPICTTFYFISDSKAKPQPGDDDAELPAILDASSQEEKLCSARLSIVLNAYGDLCGMTTLGALEIGADRADEEDLEEEENPDAMMALIEKGYDMEELMGYLDEAQKVTKNVTKIVREQWQKRGEGYGMLEMELAGKAKGAKGARKGASSQDFISKINQEMEENRRLHPTSEDDAEMQRYEKEEEYDDKLIQMIHDSHDRKVADQRLAIRGQSEGAQRGSKARDERMRGRDRDEEEAAAASKRRAEREREE